MNEIIKPEGGKWNVYTKDGKRKLGSHDSPEGAKKQLAAIEISKHAHESWSISDLKILIEGESPDKIIKTLDKGLELAESDLKTGESYLHFDAHGMTKSYHYAGTWDKEKAEDLAKKYKGRTQPDPSGEYLVITKGKSEDESY